MVISVIGLGLIGGSFCRAIRAKTEYTCQGWDADPSVMAAALSEEAVCAPALDPGQADLTILCLYPEGIVDYVKHNAARMKPGSVVMDVCGVKQPVVSVCTPLLKKEGVSFVGCHPMAGREFSGFSYSLPSLFENASCILTPTEDTSAQAVETVSRLMKRLAFREVVLCTPEEHDRIIAYTSQLPHLVSSAYIKSPSSQKQSGFSAGSFRDLSRVARLNEEMWTSLFLLNREPLLAEVRQMIGELERYREALEAGDAQVLKALLRDGRLKKEAADCGSLAGKNTCGKDKEDCRKKV